MMSKIRSGLFRLTAKAADGLIQKKQHRREIDRDIDVAELEARKQIPEKYRRFDKFPEYEMLLGHKVVADMMNIGNPFFKVMESKPEAISTVQGKSLINFSSYNYLGLTGHPLVSAAAVDAIEKFGTSASGSRVVAGERELTKGLERQLASMHGVDDCLVFVSGHATNVTTLGYLFGPEDIIIHDELIHNSALEGARLAGATRFSFPHNDLDKLDELLTIKRSAFKKAIIIIEGLYGMDGDYPNLPEIIKIKKKHGCFLMVDEAHSVGVMGEHGEGIGEHFKINRADVDIWMGTLSKAFAGCGGYIAGSHALVEMLRAGAPGQVYSVGMAPPIAAACSESIRLMYDEPERLAALKSNSLTFYDLAKKAGLPILNCQGFAVVPIICSSSKKAVQLSNLLFERGVYALPIIYPAVPESLARIRFFISANHTKEQIEQTVEILEQACKDLKIC